MKRDRDVFGQMLHDASAGLEIPEIIERNDHYISSGLPMKRYLSEYSDWPSLQQQALEYAAGRILDMGCGAGRHSLYLQEKGFDVVGLDISPKAIQLCKQRGLKKAELMSISRISRKLGKYDTILMLENNFGLVESRDGAKRMFAMFNLITTNRGRVIAQSSDPYNTNNPDNLEYQRRNRTEGRMSGQIRIRVRYRCQFSPWFDYLLVSKGEMRELLKGTGWWVTKFLETDAWSYVAIIEKLTPG